MTWNMQGGNKDKYYQIADYMKKHNINIACLQETGTLPKDYAKNPKTINNIALNTGDFKTGASSGMIYTTINYDNDTGQNNRCSMAILSEPAVLDMWAIPGPNNLRPLLGIKIPGDIWVYTVHAPSGNPNSASGVTVSMLDDMPLAQRTKRWVCAGDYNCPPAQIGGGGRTTVGGLAPTHKNGGMLDYAVTGNIALTHQSQGIEPLFSDHWSQIFDF
ncbi:MAG TPA: endonuclease/exonuclease/phosphatase family protein [Aliidongia sp.]|nr:endonuclease/exonuclease/phosphatase family protein [Aliidongia sp.]